MSLTPLLYRKHGINPYFKSVVKSSIYQFLTDINAYTINKNAVDRSSKFNSAK